jgi:hypothetical protein
MARSEQLEKNVRNFAHIFRTSVDLLEDHFAAHSNGVNLAGSHAKSDRALRASLLHRLEVQFHLGRGYLAQHRYLLQAGAVEAAEDAVRLAEKSQVGALIYASAARKANRDSTGRVLNRRAEQKIAHMRESILRDPSAKERLEELQAHIDQAESRQWQRGDGDTRLVTFIGATWCPDTVNVVEIMGCFGIPMHILIMDEDNRDEEGYLRFSDHALLAIKPNPDQERLRVPVMIFPNGERLIEPKPREFMMELVKHRIM